MSVAAIVGTVAGVVSIAATGYSIASAPGGPKQTIAGLTVNNLQTIIQSVTAEKNRLANLESKLEKAKADGDKALVSSLETKISTTKATIAKWRNEINQIQQSAGTAPIDSPAPSAAGSFSSPTTSGGGGGGSFTGSGNGGGGGGAMAETPAAGMSPQVIIGLALVAALGGGVWLATRKKKK